MEESLTKFGFRYIAAEDWGRLRRLFVVAVRFKALGALFALAALAALAPAANWVFGAHGLTAPMLAVAFLPLVQTQEDVAATALLLRGRYDLRGAFLAFSMALRLAGIAVGAHYGVFEAVLGMLAAQVVATRPSRSRGFTPFDASRARSPDGSPRTDARSRRSSHSRASRQGCSRCGRCSRRSCSGSSSGTTAVGLLRVAQAPQSGLTAASSPVRLILLTEQTRDWELGRERTVLAGVRRYMVGALGLMVVVVPVFYWVMPDLVRARLRAPVPRRRDRRHE